MSTYKLAPWNWFLNEEERHPAHRGRRAFAAPAPVYLELDRLFDNLFNGYFPADAAPKKAGELSEAIIRPNLDISADDKQYLVTVEVPGVGENDLHVEVENGTLTISGEKKYEHSGEDGTGRNYYRIERSYGSFRRALALPDDVDTQSISAVHKDGVLSISLPRRKEYLTQSRRIAVDKG